MRSIQLFLLMTLTMLSQFSIANHSPGATIFPQIGVTNYSGSSNIDTDFSYGIGLGYQFDNPRAIEYTYLKGSSSFSDQNNTAIDSYIWHINGLHHAFESKQIRPYLTFGLGETNVNVRNDFRYAEKQINFGL
jgi:OOP family OmpA-OmpF porin